MLSKESIVLAETEPGLVSVLIPAYNHERYVQETIQSIIDQTYQKIELIIINDGSRDATWQKINEMKEACEARFQRVIFQTQENAGTCVTLNRLISLARGEFIYLIASDDVALPEAIQTEYDFISVHDDYGLVVGDNYIIDENSQRVGIDINRRNVPLTEPDCFKTGTPWQHELYDSEMTIKRFFGDYFILWLGNHIPNGYLVRKSIFQYIPPFSKDAPLEDWYLHFQIAKLYKMKLLDTPLFCYRNHSRCTSVNTSHINHIANKTLKYEISSLMNNSEYAKSIFSMNSSLKYRYRFFYFILKSSFIANKEESRKWQNMIIDGFLDEDWNKVRDKRIYMPPRFRAYYLYLFSLKNHSKFSFFRKLYWYFRMVTFKLGKILLGKKDNYVR